MNPADPTRYELQLQQKLDKLSEVTATLDIPDKEIFHSEPLHFRMRAEFRIWHEGEQSHYAMTPPGQRQPLPIDANTGFPIGSRSMVELMPKLLSAIIPVPLLRNKLYALEFLTTLSGEILVTLIYHKPLDAAWQQSAEKLQKHLAKGSRVIQLIGRSRKQKLVLGRDYVIEELTVAGRPYRYQQIETGFTQPNARVNEKMLAWALACTESSAGDLLELYCGNGNFTVVLAQNFRRVLATEVAKISVESAHFNLDANNIDNVTIVRMSSEEIAMALAGVRPFRRLRDVDLSSYNFSTIFVDPPRAGLDPATLKLVRGFQRILYVSCNPETLCDNLHELGATHEIRKFAVFDQFPYSHHLECGAWLVHR